MAILLIALITLEHEIVRQFLAIIYITPLVNTKKRRYFFTDEILKPRLGIMKWMTLIA